MNKANSRQKGNKMKQARHDACWLRSQKRKTLRKLKGGHRRLESFNSKIKISVEPSV